MIPIGTNIRQAGLPRVTLALIAMNVLVFVLEAVLSRSALTELFAFFGYGPRNWYNPLAPLTSMFLHGSIRHLVFNMLFLWIFGAPIEERVGTRRYLIYYIGAGLCASVLYMLMTYASRGANGVGAIGASGAISGVMALYLYRCWYSKLKMVIDPVVFPVRFSIPAAPLVIFWFLKDFYLGVQSMHGAFTGVAHWAHVGGFLFGLMAAKVNRFGHEGRLESLRDAIMERLEQGGGWETAERELNDLYDVAPEDPGVNHDLARLYADRKLPDKATVFYRRAVVEHMKADPVAAAFIVLEHTKRLGRVLPVGLHLQAAQALVERGYRKEAYQCIIPVLKGDVSGSSSPSHERLLAFSVKLFWDMGRQADAKRAWGMFRKRFPKSSLAAEVMAAVKKPSGSVFPVHEEPATRPASAGAEAAEAGFGMLSYTMQVITDPRFIALWFVASSIAFALASLGALPELMRRNFFGLAIQGSIFLISLLLTIELRTGFLRGALERLELRRAEGDFDHKMSRQKAVHAERNEEFEAAATHYEEFLKVDGDDLDARMSLAKIYHKRLEDFESAGRHYSEILRMLKPVSPMYMEAKEALQDMEGAG